MAYDYQAYCARFDLNSANGAQNLLQQALSDWRDENIDDEQFDDLVRRSILTLGGRPPVLSRATPGTFDYDTYCSFFDLTTAQGTALFMSRALQDWRTENVNDLQFDDLMSRAISALANGQ